MKLKNSLLANALALALPLLFLAGANAQEMDKPQPVNEQPPQESAAPDKNPAAAAPSNVFTLGQITVTGKREEESALGTSTLSGEEMQDFSKESLKEALDIIPGVSVTTGSGNRNEADISIRGFDRYRVPVYLDGIRLYLPVDGRTDFDRFLTPALSEIQVSKSYVSVLNGPDGMGGAINLITRKPVKPLEAELRLSAKLGEGGQYGGYTAYANLGGKQSQYYWQASFNQRDIDHWRMSRDFTPTAAEDGGKRDNTGKKDWHGNLKFGFTPNATDEYSLNISKQEGEKHGIGSVDGTSTLSTWDWPMWDVLTLSFLSHTQLGEKSYVKTKAFYSRFENDLLAYTNISLSQPNWISHYDDNSKGVSVEFGTELLPRQTLKALFYYKRDEHDEWQDYRLATPSPAVEPKQNVVEDIYSFALEDTVHVTKTFDLVAGISRNIRRSRSAQEWTQATGLFDQPVADSFNTDLQGAAIWRYREGGKAHFSVSKRHRFPTIFERFSSRFGGALSNPWLRPEDALNFELGISERIRPGVQVDAAIFHNKVKDAITSVNVQYQGGDYTQFHNIGEAIYKGFETSLNAQVMPKLEMGGNYTYMETDVDYPTDPTLRLTTTPRHQFFLWARWKPMSGLSIIPSIESASWRWSTLPTGNNYVHAGSYTLVNFKAAYQINRNVEVSLSARNLLDKNYELTRYYPEEGRSFLLSTRLQF